MRLPYQIEVHDHMSAFAVIYETDGKYAVISIREDPIDKCSVVYKPGKNVVAALNIYFNDIDAEQEGQKLFDELDALTIWNFVDSINEDKQINTLIIHCWGGVSRSAAVAAAIEEYFNKNGNYYFNSDKYHPNMHVYKTMLSVKNMWPDGSAFRNMPQTENS